MTKLSSQNIVNHIEDVFTRRGAESYLGEDVTMAQHMLQAAQCAEKSGAEDSLIAAALPTQLIAFVLHSTSISAETAPVKIPSCHSE